MQRCEDNKESESKLLWYVDRKEVEETGHRRCQFIDPYNVLDLIEGRRRPLVIIFADDSSILTDNPRDEMWTLFAVLRRAFREIPYHPCSFCQREGLIHLLPRNARTRVLRHGS